MYLYPSITADPNIYWFGQILPDFSVTGGINAAVAINPNVPGAFFWRGQAYRRKGDADHALEDFSRAIAQSPQTEIGSYYARGQIFSAGHATRDAGGQSRPAGA